MQSPLSPPRFNFDNNKTHVKEDTVWEFRCDLCGSKHRFSQRHLTADWLAPRENDCLQMYSKVSSDWLPSYIKATQPVLETFKTNTFRTALVYWAQLKIWDRKVPNFSGSKLPTDDMTTLYSPQIKQVFLSINSFCCFSLLRSANVSMMTPKIRFSTMMMTMKKNSRS